MRKTGGGFISAGNDDGDRSYPEEKYSPQVSRRDYDIENENESSGRPTVTRLSELSDVEKAKVNMSVAQKTDEDEIPTGFLDEDEPSAQVSEDEVPTGFLDEEETALPKVEVSRAREGIRDVDAKKVTAPNHVITEPARGNTIRQERYENTGSDTSNPYVNPQNPQPQRVSVNHPENRRQPYRSQREYYGGGSNPDYLHVNDSPRNDRPTGTNVNGTAPNKDYGRNDFRNQTPYPERMPYRDEQYTEPERKKGGSILLKIVFGLFIAFLVLIGAAMIARFAKLKMSEGDTASMSGNDFYNTIIGELDNLYTDDTRSDIKDTVTTEDLQKCVDLLGEYQKSSSYDANTYNSLSQEIGTISLYMQDMKLYQSLYDGEYEIGSEGYNSTISTIRNDISMYSIVGLSSTMSSRLDILETTNSITSGSSGEDIETIPAPEDDSVTVIGDGTSPETTNDDTEFGQQEATQLESMNDDIESSQQEVTQEGNLTDESVVFNEEEF